MKLLIDTDPGIDDALAIFYAAATGADIVGLTSVHGNGPVATMTRNAIRLVEMLGLSCPVAEGAAAPLVKPPFDHDGLVHGTEGFGDVPPEDPKGKALPDAAGFITRMAATHAGELVICPIGPLTNLALALQRDPSIVSKVKRVVVMGGSLRAGGNITPHAEANIWHDPEAADAVFRAGWPVTMVGLDVTHMVRADASDFERLAAGMPQYGEFISKSTGYYLRFYASRGFDACSLHDPLALAVALRPELVQTESLPLAVVADSERRGATERAPDGPEVDVAVAVDPEAALAEILGAIAKLG